MEFSDFYVSTELLIKAFSYQLLGLLFIVIIYKLFSSKEINDNYIFDDFAGFFLLFCFSGGQTLSGCFLKLSGPISAMR